MERGWPAPHNIEEMCAKYGWNPRKEGDYIPKIYAGSLLSNELPLLKATLVEYAPYLEKYVVIERAYTFLREEKPLHFANMKEAMFSEFDDLIHHEVVHHKQHIHDPEGRGMGLEKVNRNEIAPAMVASGMTGRDIALVSDPDEIVSRELLAAVKFCDSFQGRPCASGKILAKTGQFHTMFGCNVPKTRKWFWHPDFIQGYCVTGPTDDGSPVWSSQDIRRRGGGKMVSHFTGWHFSSFLTPEEAITSDMDVPVYMKRHQDFWSQFLMKGQNLSEWGIEKTPSGLKDIWKLDRNS
eukprot:jgi/Tetstr1/442093/TSEL_030252.t1